MMKKAMFKRVKRAYRIAEACVDVVKVGDSRKPGHSYTFYTDFFRATYAGKSEDFAGANVGQQQDSYPAYMEHLWNILQGWGLIPSEFKEVKGCELALAARFYKRSQERKKYGW